MTVANRKRADAAIEKHRGRFATPELSISGDMDDWQFGCPYREEDRDRWLALLFEAFGTRSISTATVFLGQLARIVGKGWNPDDKEWRPKIEELNAAIGLVASVAPENEAEAALAAQMVALHLTAMGLARNCANMAYPDERTAATLARVTKAYASLYRSLAQLQGKLQPRQVNQTIQVVYLDQRDQRRQTAVMGGGANFGGQAHASPCCDRTPTHNEGNEYDAGSSTDARRAALPSPCANNGATVPLGCGGGEAGLPDARRFAWLRRTFGRAERLVQAWRLDEGNR